VAPPTLEEFQKRLDYALTRADDTDYRTNAGLQCWIFMERAWQRRVKATNARSLWNPIRFAGAVIPVLAADAGGSLVGHLHGTIGTVIGWVAPIGLYWDVFTYAMVCLRSDTPEDIAAALNGFAKRMGEIAMISGETTARAT
jgi:hypothetical protein